jgi:hypothetical protein
MRDNVQKVLERDTKLSELDNRAGEPTDSIRTSVSMLYKVSYSPDFVVSVCCRFWMFLFLGDGVILGCKFA